jgi:hypothetical protein
MPVRSALAVTVAAFAVGAQIEAARAGQPFADQSSLHRHPFDVLTTIVSQDPIRSARGVARAALQIDLQLLEFDDGLIDALLPFLAQRFPDLRR